MITMSFEFELPLISLVIIAIVYFSKEKVRLVENKAYEVILISSIVGAILDTIVHVLAAYNTVNQLYNKYYLFIDISNKIIATTYVVIFFSLLFYTCIISYKKVRENSKFFIILFSSINILFFIIIQFLKIEIYEVSNVKNTSGVPIILAYIFISVALFITMFISIFNIKKKDKRYYTVFFITSLFIFFVIMAHMLPGFIIYDFVMCLLCYIMYFRLI